MRRTKGGAVGQTCLPFSFPVLQTVALRRISPHYRDTARQDRGSVAQGIERPPPKRQVDGSNPSGVTSQPGRRLSGQAVGCLPGGCGTTWHGRNSPAARIALPDVGIVMGEAARPVPPIRASAESDAILPSSGQKRSVAASASASPWPSVATSRCGAACGQSVHSPTS